ncbi:hypothetical protein EWM64_g1577 [Hericium alpestre]|uniref:ABC transporter domain-containing protein n=1 Tax=Hericium alpestre TaxID=135208 RepID=A0A4Z0A7G9_9AGAM|nr:hypothetical protein EWM64_g1577 [Hericium alpestre]
MGERANLLTSHLKMMGLLDSARILSWHVSISLAYLPTWIIVSLLWHARIFSASSAGLIFVVHLILGLSLASWSFFVAMPFEKSPQLAAVASTFLAIVFAIIALVMGAVGSGTAFIFSVIFPPGYYIFAIRTIAGFENHQMPTNVLDADPDSGMRLLPIIIAGIIDIFLWPWLAVLWERRLYDAREPSSGRSWLFWRRKEALSINQPAVDMSLDAAISVRNLQKTFYPSFFRRSRGVVTAILDLSFDIPKFGIFVLLGSNGAGKSTALSIIAGLLGRTSGSVTFEGGIARPPRGTIGIVPQKNVLFPELTCYQTLRVWKAIKRSKDALAGDDDLEQLLRDCDLEKKIHENANTLSGGQKRKLQLAIGLVGVVLVDECTSGVDPLSRRALWRTLTSVRHDRTVVFTTHFLDEADLLADDIAILAAPGKLVANGSPVSLKSNLGEGYTVHVTFEDLKVEKKVDLEFSLNGLLESIRALAPSAHTSSPSPTQISYHLRTKDAQTVERVLQLLDQESNTYGIVSYDIQGTTMENIFLKLMNKDSEYQLSYSSGTDKETNRAPTPSDGKIPSVVQLTTGRKMPPLLQSFIIFQKRYYIARQSWLTPLLLVIVAIAGSCIPLFFISDRPQSCTTTFHNSTRMPLYLPASPSNFLGLIPGGELLVTPPNITSILGNSSALHIRNISDNSTFVNTIQQNFRELSLGGVSMDLQTNEALVAWEATSPGINGPILLNLASNILYNHALNSTGNAAPGPSLILANYENFPPVDAGTLVALKWIAFFGAAMSVYPAFFALYVSQERRTSVQAMQLSNGLSNPVGLWIGHLLFDSMFVMFLSTIIIIVFAAASNQFHGLGFFWFILVLYGIVGALFSYCVSLATASPLAAFAAAAGYQIVMFILYLAAYLLTLTYAKTSQADSIITILHFTLSILSPVASVMRTSFVSVNLFSLLCSHAERVSTSALGNITRYGGPITYLFIYGLVLFTILVWIDSGSILPRNLSSQSRKAARRRPSELFDEAGAKEKDTVDAETDVAATSADSLRVLHVSKTFGRNKVVDDPAVGREPAEAALAIALMGNPSVVLIDEFSTGVDAKMKREMWTMLRKVAIGKAIVITTHSMEEASALAHKVGILAKRMLAVGTTASLAARYAGYEVHFSCRTREEVMRAQQLMATIPGARMADDVATRFEVPIDSSGVTPISDTDSATGPDRAMTMTLPKLFRTLAAHDDFAEYTVEKATLESVFLKVIRANNVREEERGERDGRTKWWRLC